MTPPQERIAKLEVEVDNLKEDIKSISEDVKLIRDTLREIKGGKRVIMAILGGGAAAGAVIANYWDKIKLPG